jgi:predicted ATP-grasp superfamily ATP-dependent carboligase
MAYSKLKNPVFAIGGNINSVKIAQKFSKDGIESYLLTDKKTDIALKSKYWKAKFIASRPWDSQFLINQLKNMAKKTAKRPVVYPITDLDALNLSKVKDLLKDDFHLVVGDREATETFVDKQKFYKALSKTDIKFPATYFPNDLASAKKIGKILTYPVFIRPSITQKFAKIFGVDKGFIANSLKKLLNYYKLATSKKVEVMFQEIIPGPPTCSYQLEGYFNKEYNPTGLFARQRLRIYPPNFGNTTLCVSTPLSQLNHESKQITKLLKDLKYSGLASAEFKKDPRDNQYKLLEINARVWLHYWLSAQCGVDILNSSYLDALGQKIKYTQNYTSGIKSLYLYNDLLVLAQKLPKGKLNIFKWISSFSGVKQTALFNKNDLLPFFSIYKQRFTAFISNIPKHLGLSQPKKKTITERFCQECQKPIPQEIFSICPRCGSLQTIIIEPPKLVIPSKSN